MTTMTRTAEQVRMELDLLKTERERLDREHRDAVTANRDAQEKLRRELSEMPRPRVEGRRSRAGIDPRVQAGRYRDVALTVLRRARGPLTQAEVGRRGEIGTGTLTHAIRALESDGLVRRTGRTIDRSPELELTSQGRVTRRRPGS